MRLFFENLEALKKYMANEIETYVKAWKSDFYKYDVKEIGKINDTTAKSGKESIFFWVVRENGTFLQSVVSESTEEVRYKRAIIHQFPTARFYIIQTLQDYSYMRIGEEAGDIEEDHKGDYNLDIFSVESKLAIR